MRHSQLLNTSLAQLLMALVAVGVFGWICLAAAHTAFKLGPTDVLNFAIGTGIPTALSAGLAVGAVAFFGPVVIRFVLAKRILVCLALTALILVDPLLAAATVLAMFIIFGVIRAAHSRAGAILAKTLDFNDNSWPQRVLYTFGGILVVLAVFTTPRLPLDLGILLPWPLFSIYGLITVFSTSIVLGYITGNICFPKLINRNWAMLAFFCAMLAINPVVGFFAIIHGLLLVLIDCFASGGVVYVDDDSGWHDSILPSWHKPGEWMALSLTPGTMESEACGTFRQGTERDSLPTKGVSFLAPEPDLNPISCLSMTSDVIDTMGSPLSCGLSSFSSLNDSTSMSNI